MKTREPGKINDPIRVRTFLRILSELLIKDDRAPELSGAVARLPRDLREICRTLMDGAVASGGRTVAAEKEAVAYREPLPASLEAELLSRLERDFAAYHPIGLTGRRLGAEVAADVAGQFRRHSASPGPEELRAALALLPERLGDWLGPRRLRVEFGRRSEPIRLVLDSGGARPPEHADLEVAFLSGLIEAFLSALHGSGFELRARPDVPGRVARSRAANAQRAAKPRRVKSTRAARRRTIAPVGRDSLFALSGADARQNVLVEIEIDLHAGAQPVEQAASLSAGAPLREDQVVRRSAELLKERKELMTAVEYLNLANEQLERQIRTNKRELDMARNIQKGFVPRRIPDWKGLQFWVKFYPMAEVSGDFYDYFALGSIKLGFMVCDVSGHGVPAALISAIAKLSFNSHRLDSPAEVLNRVNLDLLNYVKKEGYLTCFYMIIDSQNNIVYSVGAAPPPMLLRAKTGEVEKLAGRGTLLGMFSDAGKHYEDRMTRLDPGDKLFVFTDGLSEAKTRHDEFLTEEQLIAVIRETRTMDVQRACEHVMEFYDRFILGRDPSDDLTLVTIMLSEREAEFNELVRQARREHNAGNLDAACATLVRAIAIFPRHTPSLFLLGRYLFQAGRLGEAQDYLGRYNALKPYNADVFTILAECAFLTDNLPLAIDHIKRSLSLRVENPGALYLAARVYDHVGRRAEALEAFRELEHLRPRDHRTAEIRELLDI